MDNIVFRVLALTCFLLPYVEGAASPWATQETALRASYWTGYDAQTRPKERNNVVVALHLISMNYLDIKEQTLSVTGYITAVWDDSRLDWSADPTYNSMLSIYTKEQYVWTPSLVVENSVDDIDVISTSNNPIRVRKTGTMVWKPDENRRYVLTTFIIEGGIIKTECLSDVTYWPLDHQTCQIILSAWSYNTDHLMLSIDPKNLHLDFYEEHGEWELVDASYKETVKDRETESFSQVVFTLNFKRRPLYHTLNTLFPVILMGFLTVIVFKLNPESGERVGLSLTILLAYAVYLTLIAESIPTTSTSASLLSTYLASILLLQTLSVFLTVVYLDMFFKPDDEPVPDWLNKFAKYVLLPLTLTKCCCAGNESRVSPDVTEVAEYDEESRTPQSAGNGKVGMKVFDAEDQRPSTTGNQSSEAQFTWKEIALLFDKATMYIYLAVITLGSLALLAVLVINYQIS